MSYIKWRYPGRYHIPPPFLLAVIDQHGWVSNIIGVSRWALTIKLRTVEFSSRENAWTMERQQINLIQVKGWRTSKEDNIFKSYKVWFFYSNYALFYYQDIFYCSNVNAQISGFIQSEFIFVVLRANWPVDQFRKWANQFFPLLLFFRYPIHKHQSLINSNNYFNYSNKIISFVSIKI